MHIKSNGQRTSALQPRRFFISHRHEDFPIAYLGGTGRFFYRPAIPNPPVEVTYRKREVDIFGQFQASALIPRSGDITVSRQHFATVAA
jgi:hypothetical protein